MSPDTERSTQIMQKKIFPWWWRHRWCHRKTPKSVPLYWYVYEKWTFFVITQWSTTQRNTTQWSTTQHNRATQQRSTTQWSTVKHNGAQHNRAKYICQYVCSGWFVNQRTHIRVKCLRFVCDFSSNMTVGPVSSSSEDILTSRELRFACIHKELWVNCSQTCVNIVDHV